MNRLPASGPGARIGSLVLNPGGPGGSGLDYARAARRVVPAAVRARFDVVGFDPRGVGASTRVECLDDAATARLLAVDPSPDDPAETRELDAVEKGFAQACAANAGPLLAHVSTVEAARDLDDLRAALGDAGLTFLGKSYGTFLGATYAELFPSHVRALVLDGVVDPTLTQSELDRVQAVGFEDSFDAFLAWCAGRGGCGLGCGDAAALETPVRRAGRGRSTARAATGGGRTAAGGGAALLRGGDRRCTAGRAGPRWRRRCRRPWPVTGARWWPWPTRTRTAPRPAPTTTCWTRPRRSTAWTARPTPEGSPRTPRPAPSSSGPRRTSAR